MLMRKKNIFIGFIVVLLLVLPFSSANFSEVWDKITGRVTSSPVTHNITVTAGSSPIVYDVVNETMTDVSSGPTEDSPTYVIINFSVSDSDGFGNINDSTAAISFNFSGTTRSNTSCARYAGSGNIANYTCNVTLWWFDAPGTWSINASISDTSNNYAENITDTFYLGATDGFSSSPSELTWGSISPGEIGVEPSDNVLMNNTGNRERNIQINATDLLGEENPAQALWAANFSAHTDTGCGGTTMVADTYTAVSGATLPIGNYTIDNTTGQEEIFICLEAANAILDAQSYSTAARGTWTVKIVA